METVSCDLCGSKNYSAVYEMPDRLFYREEFFTVVECRECGLAFLNPRPSREEMQKYYPANYYQGPPTKSHQRYLKRRFGAEARYLEEIERRGGGKKLLDVGCANGDFPRFMKARGWEVEGVEVSSSSERITDFKVHTEEFQKIAVNEPMYDAVTAWAVLEHVHSPMEYFQKAAQVTKPGGLFVFLVPNYASLASKKLFCEDVPRHLYYFSRTTATRYLEKSGFALVKQDNTRTVYKLSPHNWLGYMLRTKLLGKSYEYKDVPLTSKEFRRVRGLKGGLVTALKYAAYSPLCVIDRMLWPVTETAQILRKTYGVSTYVARKK